MHVCEREQPARKNQKTPNIIAAWQKHVMKSFVRTSCSAAQPIGGGKGEGSYVQAITTGMFFISWTLCLCSTVWARTVVGRRPSWQVNDVSVSHFGSFWDISQIGTLPPNATSNRLPGLRIILFTTTPYVTRSTDHKPALDKQIFCSFRPTSPDPNSNPVRRTV